MHLRDTKQETCHLLDSTKWEKVNKRKFEILLKKSHSEFSLYFTFINEVGLV